MVLTRSERGAGREGSPTDRVLAGFRGPDSGPTLVCLGGLHGNEPAGVSAIRRVANHLGAGLLRGGDFVGILGNRAAMESGARFVEDDLNRMWTPGRVQRVRRDGPSGGAPEELEQAEILLEIERAIAAARGPVYLLDLHTTSGPGGIFSVFGDALQHRAFAAAFPVPMVLGLEELVDGTLTQYFGERGVVAVTVETGSHDAPESVDRAEAAIWVALWSLGMLRPDAVERAEEADRLLRHASAHLPRALEMRHRHAIRPGDGFRMAEGYRNFDRVSRGDVLGHDRHGEVRATETARILMPLYQVQGDDGFFLVRRFSPFWMGVSAALRRARVDRVAHLLPGVRRVEGDPDAVAVDRTVARFFAKQLFHLLGFRKVDESGPRLVMRRRPGGT